MLAEAYGQDYGLVLRYGDALIHGRQRTEADIMTTGPLPNQFHLDAGQIVDWFKAGASLK